MSASLPSPRTDPVFGGALLLLAAAFLPSLLPLGISARTYAQTIGHPVAIGAALLAIVARRRGDPRRARVFWWLIATAFVCLLAARIWRAGWPQQLELPHLATAEQLLYLGCYLAVVMAFETKPTRRASTPAQEELRILDTAGAGLFLFALVTYMTLITGIQQLEVYRTMVPPHLLYVVLDIFLVVRAVTLLEQSSPGRWRSVYGWLGVTFLLWGIHDLFDARAELAGRSLLEASSPLDFLWFLPFLTVTIAARLESGSTGGSGSESAPSAGGHLAPLVAYAFALPIFHLVVQRLGILDPRTDEEREFVVLGFLAGVALLLWIYQRILIRENGRLEDERAQMARETAQVHRLEGLGRLAGGVAHDFNNLITVIRGRTELLLVDHADDQALREDLEAIRQATRRAEGVTRQLLAFGRRQMLRPEVLDLGHVVSDLAPLLRSALSEEVHLSVAIRDYAPLIVADQGQFELAVLNLSVNAREAMPGGGTLAFTIERVQLDERAAADIPGSKAGAYVLLTVQDTGRGMDDATLARIFEPFFTTKPFGAGSGLGLPAVHGFVRQSGGAVTVTSSPGRGAAFHIYLPRIEGAQLKPARARVARAASD